MKKSLMVLRLCALFAGAFSAADLISGEIGFIEDYSLSENRTEAMKQLIPGTEDYFYYRCLNFLNTGDLAQAEAEIKKWIDAFGNTPRVELVRNRHALLLYSKDPQKSLNYIKSILNLQFNHQKETSERRTENIPVSLDQKLISFDTLKKRAFARTRNTVEGFELSGLDFLTAQDMSPDVRRSFLSMLSRPDFSNLSPLIIEDLKYRNSGGFGSFRIHSMLLLDQLDECVKLMPELRNQGSFVNTYLLRLKPADDVDFLLRPEEEKAYYDRLWNFARTLAPVHNSLKSNIIFQQLKMGQRNGDMDKKLFMEYIKLPKNVYYMKEEYSRSFNDRSCFANIHSNFSHWTLLPPVMDDTALVNDYLQFFLKDAENWNEFADYIRDDVLKRNFAYAKILNGVGDQEKWYPMLSPSEYQVLKDRVDLDFSPRNKEYFRPDENVSLTLNVKNVEKLFVKIYRLNLFNFYKDNMKEPNVDICLDGLVPNEEKVQEYREVSLRRIERTFEFPSLKERGVYIVDFIGGGKVSRAIVRKGRLRAFSQITAAGHVFSIYDENNAKIDNGSIWMDGHKYDAEKEGVILLPFSTNPARQNIIVSSGDFCSLDNFRHQAENYVLKAGIFVDRESLIKRKDAKVVVRPVLYVGDEPVSLSILEKVRLVINTQDLDGVSTVKTIEDFKLFPDKDSVETFNVPENTRSISFTLMAQARSLSQGKDVNLSSQTVTFGLNGIDSTALINELLLSKSDGKYFLRLLDKSGAPLSDRPLQISMKNKYFKEPVHVQLKTDAGGYAELGALKDIVSINVNYSEGQQGSYCTLANDMATYPLSMNVPAGEAFTLPYVGVKQAPDSTEISLLEMRGGNFVSNCLDKVSIKDGFISIKGLAAGTYSLLLKDEASITLYVQDGKKIGNAIVSDLRISQISKTAPLQIANLAVKGGKLTAKIANADSTARIHVFADQYNYGMTYSPFLWLASPNFPGCDSICQPPLRSGYCSGIAIGSEYDYIIRRRFAQKFPGNMLQRPGLLLNPFALRITETLPPEPLSQPGMMAGRGAAGGRAMDRKGAAAKPQAQASAAGYFDEAGKVATSEDIALFPNLDFFSERSPVFLNLVPDKDGLVEIPVDSLAGRQEFTVVAVDSRSAVSRSVSAAPGKIGTEDVRLPNSLDVQKHFVETKNITTLSKGGKLVINDLTTSSYNIYDTQGKVFGLYSALNVSPELAEFSFITQWSSLDDKAKLEKYAKYACHELNWFIYRKDRAFFDKNILPFLKNKKDKTFLDLWFTGDKLDDYMQVGLYRNRLNALEKILLASKLKDEKATSRFILEEFDMIPPDPNRTSFLFNTALKSGSLDVEADKEKAFELAKVAPREKLLLEAAEDTPVLSAPTTPSAPPMAVKAKKLDELKMMKEEISKESEAQNRRQELADGNKDRAAADEQLSNALRKRAAEQQLYRKLDQTSELAENNYYKLPIEEQESDLVNVNAFWNDFSKQGAADAFLSANFAEASGNFTECMLAMASMDIPFKAEKVQTDLKGRTLTITATSPMVVFHKEISEAKLSKEKTPMLAGQRYFKADDRFTYDHNQKIDKYVSGEFLGNTVYGCFVAVTNPTSSARDVDVLLQIPQGAVPVASGFYTKTMHWNLQPFTTQRFEYFFYFPKTGTFSHYPAQVSINEELVAFCEASTMNVVAKLKDVDTTSWQYVSQEGTPEQVLEFLGKNNINRIELPKIAFRMRDKEFFLKTYKLLDAAHAYDEVLWSYGIFHNFVPAIREYLKTTPIAANCGSWLESEILTVAPVVRRTYQFLEYSPFVNARICQLGPKRTIQNEAIFQQYKRLLNIISFKKDLDNDDLMAVTYYMLLQDRVAEALKFFAKVDPAKSATKMQYDYFAAYLAFCQGKPDDALKIAEKYKEYPAINWRNKFLEIVGQSDEIKGNAAPKVVDKDSRETAMTAMASKEPSLDFEIDGGKVNMNYANIGECRVSYYLMDVEFLFSNSPFSKDYGKQFSYIVPNKSEARQLQAGKTSLSFDLPADLLASNLLVEISSSGKKAVKTYYANTMNISLEENFGQIKVADRASSRNLPAVYIKVYAKMNNGSVKFYKDGYTDLRGRFDYASLNTDEISNVEKFSILVMSDSNGAVVKEAAPPKR